MPAIKTLLADIGSADAHKAEQQHYNAIGRWADGLCALDRIAFLFGAERPRSVRGA